MKKRVLFVLIFGVNLILILSLGFQSFAKENDELPTPDSYVQEVVEDLPDDIKTHLPQGESYDELAQNIDSGYLLSLSLSFLKRALHSVYTYLVFFLVALLISALSERLEDAFGNKDTGLASYISTLLIAYEAFSIVYVLFQEVAEYCKQISAYMLTYTSVMGSVSLLGGGVMQSAKASMALSVTVSFLGSLCSILLLPIVRMSFATSVTTVVSKRINLNELSSFIRGFFTFLIGFVSLVSIVAITFQTMLAQAEDTLAARSIRFAASSSIPIVGNAVGDSVRTMGAAITVIQKSVGTVGAAGLIIMTLYPLSVLFSAKIAFSLSHTIAGLFNIDSASKLLSDVSHIINMLMATVSILSVLYIFVVALFTSTAIPIA